jgi:phosphate transport system protein
VCRSDDDVDRLHRAIFEEAQREMLEHPDRLLRLVQHLSISRYLERIADHATNIAEDVIYLAEGVIVRHRAARRVGAGRPPAGGGGAAPPAAGLPGGPAPAPRDEPRST